MDGATRTLPEVTVVLLVCNPTDWDVQTIPLVRRQTYPGRTVIHVIDSSPDHSGPHNLALAEASDLYERLPTHEFGHARTRNHAMDRCSTELIVYLSCDAHPVNDQWLAALVRPIAAGEADVSYGRQRSRTANPERAATYSFFYPEHRMIKRKEQVAELGIRVYHFSDVTAAYRTEVLRRLRFPDELDIFEDAGISKRLLDEGHVIAYEPSACVIHGHDRGWSDMWRYYRRLGYVYSKLGILEDVAAARRGGLAGEATAAFKRLARVERRHPLQGIRQVTLTAVKGLAFARGKRAAGREAKAA